MTYKLYDLILDLTEAGLTVQFKPCYVDDGCIKPKYIDIFVRNNKVLSNRHLERLGVRDAGEDELVSTMIDMEKYIIIRMAEDEDESSTAQGTGPTE